MILFDRNMKTVILFACLLGLAFQAEVHQRVARSLSSSDSDESGAFFPDLRQPFLTFNYDQLRQLLMAFRTALNPAPAPVPTPRAAPSTAPNPVPTLAPITAR